MSKTRNEKALTTASWVNPVIVAVFLVTDTIGNYNLGWKRDTTYFIVWWAFFLAVLALVNIYVFLRAGKPEKI